MSRQSPDRSGQRRAERRPKRVPKPLDAARLEELALAYVARFATSRARLESYLACKLRERGWTGEESEPSVTTLAERFVSLGYVDDAAFARAKAGSLLRRGYGQRRVTEALGAAGIGEEIREQLRAGEGTRRRAALTMARKRRLGPFGPGPTDRAAREKQIAAMLRAGHSLDSARELVNAASAEAAEEWAASGFEDDRCE